MQSASSPAAAKYHGVPAIQVHGMSAALGGAPVLRHVSLAIPAGRWTSIVGPNGAGKSSLLKVMAGLLPHTGELELMGRSMASFSHRERARRLSWLGQGESAVNDLSVYDVAMLGRLPHQTWLARASEQDRQAVEHALRAMQAWEWRHRSLAGLSGGERQRVLLARALAVQADVMLMDEPLANLDPPHQADWLGVVRGLVEQGKTVVSVLHEISLALQADDMVLMRCGEVAYQGLCRDPATHTALEQVFDGRVTVHQLGGQWVALPKV